LGKSTKQKKLGGRAFRGAWHLTSAEASARFCKINKPLIKLNSHYKTAFSAVEATPLKSKC
jgi:hypothetical protein